jgi:hypothetical protein
MMRRRRRRRMRRRTSSAWFQGYPKTGAPVMSISRCESKDAAEAFTRPGLLGERRSGGLLRKCGEVARYALLNEIGYRGGGLFSGK